MLPLPSAGDVSLETVTMRTVPFQEPWLGLGLGLGLGLALGLG